MLTDAYFILYAAAVFFLLLSLAGSGMKNNEWDSDICTVRYVLKIVMKAQRSTVNLGFNGWHDIAMWVAVLIYDKK